LTGGQTPVDRHALGALLLEQGRVQEAEAVYRPDLGLDDAQPALPASGQRLEPAWLPRVVLLPRSGGLTD
jgi:hypothetical protein